MASDRGWFGRRNRPKEAMASVPEGIAAKCQGCSAILFARDLERNLGVCSKCGHHHRMGAAERIESIVDEESFTELDAGLRSLDPLGFPEYPAKQTVARTKTGLDDAVITGTAAIDGQPLVIGVADFAFMGGSMGSVVGERVSRAIEHGVQQRLPVVMFTASGGARMQEGLVALMQMPKTCAAAARLHKACLPYVNILTDPTTGGVYASYATLGDVILAEPGATVGFAGRRVGNQELTADLPANFQTSEFQFEHGMVDRIVQRKDMRPTLAALLRFFGTEGFHGS